MSLADAAVLTIAAFAPLLFVGAIMFVVFSWLRILLDHMSGRGF